MVGEARVCSERMLGVGLGGDDDTGLLLSLAGEGGEEDSGWCARWERGEKVDMARRVDVGEAGGDSGRSISNSSSVPAAGGDGGAPFMDETDGDGDGDIRLRSMADRLGDARLIVSGNGRDTIDGMKDSGRA